jgi:3'(2'), 5'-bisphosphate nucleotidase
MIKKNRLLTKATAVSKHAGRLILEWYQDRSYHVLRKPDTSPLTEADLASETCIVSALSKTGIPVISEETGCAYSVRKDWNSFWLVDPLDGTKDFIARNGEFTVNIALIEHGEPVLGVIHAPAIDLTCYAGKGNGAFCEKDGRVKRLPCAEPLGHVIATVSRQHLSAKTKEFLRINGITDVEPRGSALKFGIVASGKATVYPRFEGSMEWDTAAGQVIITEAGCRIFDLLTGTVPVYNKPSLVNNPFIVCAPHIERKTLSIPDINTSQLR